MTFDEWLLTILTKYGLSALDVAQQAWYAGHAQGYESGCCAFAEAVKLEREACAKECENLRLLWLSGKTEFHGETDFQACADRIRMRSNVVIEVQSDGSNAAGSAPNRMEGSAS